MNALEMIWRDLKNWLRRKRIFAVDAASYESLRLVAQREQRPPEEVAARLFEQAADQQTSQSWALERWEELSPRQRQIAAYICRGDSTRQIAGQLNIAQTTVKSHVEAILRKFGIHSRVALRQILAPWDLNSYL